MQKLQKITAVLAMRFSVASTIGLIEIAVVLKYLFQNHRIFTLVLGFIGDSQLKFDRR